jgi:soluble lytic murein transglycosylase
MAAAETIQTAFKSLDPHDAALWVSPFVDIDRKLWWIDPAREELAVTLRTNPGTTGFGYDLLHQLTTNGRYSWTRARAAKELAASMNVEHRLAAAEALLEQGQAREAGALIQGIANAFRNDTERVAQWKYLNGRSLISLGRGAEGLQILRALVQETPDTVWARKALQFDALITFASDRQRGNERAEEMVRRYPHAEETANLLWSLAKDRDKNRDPKGAVVYYLRLVETCPQHSLAAEALFEAAAINERGRATNAALELYRQLLETYPHHKVAGEAGFRCGRILENGRDIEGAKAVYAAAASAPVGDFYLHRCAERLHVLGGDPSKVGHDLRVTHAESFVRPVRQPIQLDANGNDRWANTPWRTRLEFFGARGYLEAEWEALYLIEKFEGAPRAGQLFQVLADAGVAATAQDLMVATNWGVDNGRPTPGRMQVLFPRPYWNDVRALASETGVDPYLMLAIAKQESTFRPKIGSHAGAQGVMQLMPPTAQFVARTEANVSPQHAENLHDPASSLRLGSYYLKQMIRRSDGNLVFALASYNAGPGNLDKWKRRFGTNDLERFVESIPFNETRNYVKKVLGNYAAYHSLYGTGS